MGDCNIIQRRYDVACTPRQTRDVVGLSFCRLQKTSRRRREVVCDVVMSLWRRRRTTSYTRRDFYMTSRSDDVCDGHQDPQRRIDVELESRDVYTTSDRHDVVRRLLYDSITTPHSTSHANIYLTSLESPTTSQNDVYRPFT